MRRERAQAAIIDNQAKRLDEPDSLYYLPAGLTAQLCISEFWAHVPNG